MVERQEVPGVDSYTPGLFQRLNPSPQKVVLVRPSRLGDFICAIPAFRAIRTALPNAEIHLITLPILQDLAERLTFFDRVIPFPGYPGIAEQLFDARQTTTFFQQMQAERYDLAVQIQESGVFSNPFVLMLGARFSAGFVRAGDPPGRLDAALPISRQGHEIRRVLALATFLGAPSQGEEIQFSLTEADWGSVSRFLADCPKPWIGLHAAARSNTRRWPIERFISTALKILDVFGGTVVLLGEIEEQTTSDRMEAGIGKSVVNLVGRTRLSELAAVIERLSLLITNDSGPAHMAYALRTPTVTIFGGGDPERYGPLLPGPFRCLVYPVVCRPCSFMDCPINSYCLAHIQVDQVVLAASQVIR